MPYDAFMLAAEFNRRFKYLATTSVGRATLKGLAERVTKIQVKPRYVQVDFEHGQRLVAGRL